jgi:hypothetical protein
MNENERQSNPLLVLIDQAKGIVRHHPELAASYLAAIREKAKGMKPGELEPLLGDLPKIAEAARRPARSPLSP